MDGNESQYGSLTPGPEVNQEEKKDDKKKKVMIGFAVLALLGASAVCIGTGILDRPQPIPEEEVAVRVTPTKTAYAAPQEPTPTEAEPTDFLFPGGFANYIRWDPEYPIEFWSTPAYLEFSTMDESGNVWLSAKFYIEGNNSDPKLMGKYEGLYSVFNPGSIGFPPGKPLIVPDGREILIFSDGLEMHLIEDSALDGPSRQEIEQMLGKEVECWVYSGSDISDLNGCDFEIFYEMHYDKLSGLLIFQGEYYPSQCGEPAHSYFIEIVETNIPLGTDN